MDKIIERFSDAERRRRIDSLSPQNEKTKKTRHNPRNDDDCTPTCQSTSQNLHRHIKSSVPPWIERLDVENEEESGSYHKHLMTTRRGYPKIPLTKKNTVPLASLHFSLTIQAECRHCCGSRKAGHSTCVAASR